MQLAFGDYQVDHGEMIPLELAQKPASLQFAGNPQELYTILMYDPDAVGGPYLHYEVINVPGNDLSQGEVTFPYQPPNPPPGSGIHRYIFMIILQSNKRPSDSAQTRRSPFPLVSLMEAFGLVSVEELVVQVPSPQPINGYSNEKNWLDKQALPNEKDRTYCRCILEVAGKQPEACNRDRAWFKTRDGQKCFNPYPVCHNSVKGESGQPECGNNYLFEQIPDNELVGYASLNKISVPYPYDRQRLLENIQRWKQQKYE